MKATTLKKAAVIAGSLSFLAGSAFSQTAVSGAGGYTTLNLAVGFNLVGVSLFDPVLISGTIDAENGATITDADPDFAAVLSDAAATYLIEITSGGQSGAVAEIASVTDSDNIELTGAIGAGTADYTIRQAPTLNDVFGTQLQGGANAGQADVVWLPAGGGAFDQVYFYSTIGSEFRASTSPFASPAKPVAVFYPDALFVQVQNTAKDVVVTGMVKTTDTVVSSETGFNLAAVNAPVGQTFGNSGLDAFLSPGANAGAADIVWLPAGGGNFTQYFYSTIGNTWRLSTSPFAGDESGTALTSGMFIQRTQAGTPDAGVLTVPPFYANL